MPDAYIARVIYYLPVRFIVYGSVSDVTVGYLLIV